VAGVPAAVAALLRSEAMALVAVELIAAIALMGFLPSLDRKAPKSPASGNLMNTAFGSLRERDVKIGQLDATGYGRDGPR
jgi:hypothetical protein